MLTYEKAKTIALEHLNNPLQNDKIILLEPGIEFEYGWIFSYSKERYSNPKLLEIYSKIDFWRNNGKSDEDIEELITQDESEILMTGIAPAGALSLNLIVDKKNHVVTFKESPAEAIIQEIIEEKTEKEFIWNIYILSSMKGNLEILT